MSDWAQAHKGRMHRTESERMLLPESVFEKQKQIFLHIVRVYN